MAGQRPLPSLAAVLIVRDEAENLPACLASLTGLVDEIHVHDTGSTDGTPELAAGLGALVTTAPWKDDFAAARNTALACCRTEWVLSLDADDRANANASELRRLLADPAMDAVGLDIDNASDELPYTHHTVRLFRPERARWSGRVHERLVARTGSLRIGAAPRAAIVLSHLGYRTAHLRQPKAVRNTDLAQTILAELGGATDVDRAAMAQTLLDLGRSFLGSGRRQDAVDTFETIREMFPGTEEWIQATDFLARIVLGEGLDDVCLALVAQLRETGVAATYCDWLEAQALAQLGRAERAWALLEGVHEVVDTAGRRHDPAALRELTALVDQLRRQTPPELHGILR